MQDSVLAITTFGRATEILWHKTSVAGSIPDGDIKGFYNLLVMYWTLNIAFAYSLSTNVPSGVSLLSRAFADIKGDI